MKIYIKYRLKTKNIENRPLFAYNIECKAYYNKPRKLVCNLKCEYSIPRLIDQNYCEWTRYSDQEESEMIRDFLNKMQSNIKELLKPFIKEIELDIMVDEGSISLKNEYLKGYRTLEIEIGDN